MSLVLDAALALSWCLEDGNAAADRLLDLVVEHGAVVPAIWRLEVANALQMAVRQGRIAAAYRDRALAFVSHDLRGPAQAIRRSKASPISGAGPLWVTQAIRRGGQSRMSTVMAVSWVWRRRLRKAAGVWP